MKNKRYFVNLAENEGMWHFELWHTKKQAMGYSIEYKDIEECKKGLKDFQKFLLDNPDITKNEKLLKIARTEDNKHIYQFLDSKRREIYTSRKLEQKVNCKKAAESTQKHLPEITECERIKINLE